MTSALPGHRAHLYYSGRVQGVGFRLTADQVASSLGLSGFVKNLPDARVEVVCEGDEAAIKKLMGKLGDVFGQYIRGVDVEWSRATGEFEGFSVEFD